MVLHAVGEPGICVTVLHHNTVMKQSNIITLCECY